MSTIFWYNNINIILDKGKLYEFVPKLEMTTEDKLNSLVRLSLYMSVILSLLTNNINFIFILLCTCFITYIIYVFNEKNEKK